MARLTWLVLALVCLVSSASAQEKRGFHTRFSFSVFGARSYSTDEQVKPEALGTSDGWTCNASAIDVWEPARQPGDAKQSVSRTASITCADVSGASATISATCNVAAAERSGSSVQLKSAKNQKGFPLAVHIECQTETR